MKKLIILITIPLIIIAIILYLNPFQTPSYSLSLTKIATLNNQEFILEIAQTPQEKQQGLMYRSSLPKNQGMIFVYDIESPRTFWMKNTLIPLDLIFLDSDNIIIDIKHNFQPCISDPCESYTSKQPAKDIIEINAGLAEELGLEVGEIVYVGI